MTSDSDNEDSHRSVLRRGISSIQSETKPTGTEAGAGTLPKVIAAQSEQRQNYGGSTDKAFNEIISNQTGFSLTPGIIDGDYDRKQIQAAVAALKGINPKDEIEGMLAAQMVATHNAAMECFRRAAFLDQGSKSRLENLNLANKLSQSYAALMKTLDRHRGKGQQHVTVEYVNVQQSGNTFLGPIIPGGGGNFAEQPPFAKQSHAKGDTLETGAPMPSTNQERTSVPVPSRKGKDPL